ncbi:MAG: vanillate O-demethylase oxidoreductase VanB [Hydrocarboniphaga sp.]|uniref:SRPBCC family protein n=1 Tax=Hydrocarboniphaga sp. TaxID=2033016 RepID=UPI0026300A06|nr:SRPBCC family protein [Hydrocarboniphaga sp.]MDB5967791.1 vanillate O-demethylase oxidoreductase VanB [Hydrocarboniphaga sp.]
MLINTDRIEKQVVLRAQRERVWQAVSDAGQFGHWFGVAFDGPFVEGARMIGRITPTRVDAEVAKLQQPHENKPFEFHVDRIEPMDRITFRWHPFAIEPGTDYSQEPMTLIEFVLDDHADGTRLTITESGFDRIPLARRAQAFAANEGGWTHQIELIRKYLLLQQA